MCVYEFINSVWFHLQNDQLSDLQKITHPSCSSVSLPTSKSEEGRMSVISTETPSLFSGLSGLEEPSSSVVEFIEFNSSVSTTSKSQAVR